MLFLWPKTIMSINGSETQFVAMQKKTQNFDKNECISTKFQANNIKPFDTHEVDFNQQKSLGRHRPTSKRDQKINHKYYSED